MGFNLLIHIHMKGQSQTEKTLAKHSFQLCWMQRHTANSVQPSSVLGQTQGSLFRGVQSSIPSLQSTGVTHTKVTQLWLSSEGVYQSHAPSPRFPADFCFNAHFDTGSLLLSIKLNSLWEQLQTKFTSHFAKHRIFKRMNEWMHELKTHASSISLLKKSFQSSVNSERLGSWKNCSHQGHP